MEMEMELELELEGVEAELELELEGELEMAAVVAEAPLQVAAQRPLHLCRLQSLLLTPLHHLP